MNLTQIEQRFETEAAKLVEIRERFRARAVRWAYSETEIWSWLERRQLVAEDDMLADSKNARYSCGYDASNRPILLCHFDSETIYGPVPRQVPLETMWCEEFIEHQEDTLEVLRFVRGKLDRLSRLRFEGRLLVEDESVIQGVYQHTLTHHEGSKKKRQQSINNKGKVFFEIDFGPHGEQSYFRVRRDGSRFQLCQPLPKGITVKSLKDTVRERLLELVPELVSAAAVPGPIYCVALAYDDEGNDALPPIIGIGMESERRRWMAEHGKRAKDFVWNPAEFQHYERSETQLSDDALEEACDYLNSKWAETGSTAAANFLVETAAALSQADWPASIQRTPDFVVFAVGFEGGGLNRSLKASLGPEKLALLKRQGLF
jgi:hypothetical protein